MRVIGRALGVSLLVTAGCWNALGLQDKQYTLGAGGGSTGTQGSGGSASHAGMVHIDHGSLSYYIDATEVTNAAYAAWLSKNPSPNQTQDPRCNWNSSFAPGVQESPCTGGVDATCAGFDARAVKFPNQPVGCVDWCDALSYCEQNGKHLCGGSNGMPIVLTEEPGEFVGSDSQWYFACSGGTGKTYPYGSTLDPDACNDGFNGVGTVLDVGEPSCQGGFPGLYDMSGNVDEWTDACFATDGTEPNCVRGGGAYYSDGTPGHVLPSCAEETTFEVRCQNNSTGFRCCAE